MGLTEAPATQELLIASLTPQNLERGVLWFAENRESIKRARKTNPWWRTNAFLLEKDLVIKPGELSRKLIDFGYERRNTLAGKGIFAVRGGIIEVWPINTPAPYLVEFSGNAIILIQGLPREELTKPKFPKQSLEALAPGSHVVHVDHGIGIFRGLKSLEMKARIKNTETETKYFVIEYAPPSPGKKPDTLYVPANQKDRLSPYIGFETPRIHRLGGTVWFTTKRKAREDTEKLAKELLALYAKREHTIRPPHEGDKEFETKIRETFPFSETEDQLQAEAEIMRDLSSTKPMDRILCGDVGFGKTEIALRAALRVICSGGQVALISPTTILALQHERTFEERLTDAPIRVAMLSRLTPLSQEKEILSSVSSGKIDCLIGTHRLLSRDIQFKNLGLVIIDEEQRFGVKQKEHFKNLRAEIDLLSLSATPIPRTLSFILSKIRSISVLSSPPLERQAIVTTVLPYSKRLVKSALMFELARGGQIYFLHNRVETIGQAKNNIEELLKEGGGNAQHYQREVGVIHGRMGEVELVRVMNKFRAKEINILVATTIIENGLDISSANTLIVDDAVKLGLAQAHQLRGRIGRGSTQGFAYFLYPARKIKEKKYRQDTSKPIKQFENSLILSGAKNRKSRLSQLAEERLQALQEYSELGEGYKIALRDLEIRGAGNMLGKEQSGTINKVGLNLYYQMLAEAVEELRTGLIGSVAK